MNAKIRSRHGEQGVVALGLALVLGAISLSVLVQDWFVDVSSPGCPGTGTQADPFCTIMDAVAAAADGDTIHIAPGTYFENVVLDEDLNLIGTAGQQVTILDGSASGSVVRVAAAAVTLTELTLTNGSGSPSPFLYGPPGLVGGGLFGYRASYYDPLPRVVLTSCTVAGNTASLGGGLAVYDGTLTIRNCLVNGNSAGSFGGIWTRGLLTVEGSTVEHNGATDAYGTGGIGACDALITNSTVTQNTANFAGGIAIGCGGMASYGSLTLTSSTVSGNTGAGIRAYFSDVTINSSAVNSNDGYGIVGNDGYLDLTDSEVSGNHSVGIFSTAATLVNSTVTGNQGDGILTFSSCCTPHATLMNSTVSGNNGFGLNLRSVLPYYSSAATVANSIFWDNGLGSIHLFAGSTAAVDHTLIAGGWPGVGNINADPLFVDPPNGDFRLSPGSPCIDAGDDTAVPLDIWTDLDGKRRFIDDPLTPDTGRSWHRWPVVDMGAHEFGNDPPRKVRQR